MIKAGRKLPQRPPKGVITTEDMFSALRRSLLTGEKINAGVCRDMHLSMAKTARAMGLQNAFGVSYATRAGAHLILTTTPDSYGTVSTINYGKIEHSKGKSEREHWSSKLECHHGD